MHTPARSYEIGSLLGDADPMVVERVLETGASIDEISEALHLIEHDDVVQQEPSSARVVEVRAILSELVGEGDDEVGVAELDQVSP